MTIKAIWNCWRQFWFEPCSPLPLCLFRIFFGILLLQSALVHTLPSLSFWYGPDAVNSIDSIKHFFWQGDPQFDLLLMLPNTDEAIRIFFFVYIAAAFFLTIGFCSNASAVVVALSLVSLHHHQPFNINGGDSFLRLASLFLVFARSGSCLSVDRWLKICGGSTAPVPLINPCFQRLIQVQLAIVYWQTFCCKIVGPQWLDGTAVYYATRLDDMTKFAPPGINSVLACRLLSWFTLVVELGMWTVVWFKESRYYVLLGALILHLGIDYTINLPIFEWAFMATLVLFVEPKDLERFFSAARQFSIASLARCKTIKPTRTIGSGQAVWSSKMPRPAEIE